MKTPLGLNLPKKISDGSILVSAQSLLESMLESLTISTDPAKWISDQKSWDMQTGRYTKHIQYEDIKLIIVYNRIYEDVLIVEKVNTLDGQNIIDLVRDRALTVIEKMLAKDFK